MKIKRLEKSEIPGALSLAWEVFSEFEAPDYSEEGIGNFKRFIDSAEMISALVFYGAFEEEKLVGIIATRNAGNHIALFFVDGRYHRRGIGRKLFEEILKDNTTGEITVHSSPYAVEVYRHLGFIALDRERMTDGIRYTPMRYPAQTESEKFENFG